MFADRFSHEFLNRHLLPRDQFRPFPSLGIRDAWESLPPEVIAARLQAGEAALGSPWPAIPASLALEFVRTGNRKIYEDAHFPRRSLLGDLVLAECVENRGRFTDAIVNAVWSICEETYWGVSAHVGMQRAGAGLPDVEEPTVDLFVGETVALLAWTTMLVGETLDEVSPLVTRRILAESKRRVLDPCLERDDFPWMGLVGHRDLNNWTPWIVSNWLTAALVLETDPDRRVQAIAKALRSLDAFVAQYPADGGCDEGTSYWNRAGGSLFDCLEILSDATDGALDLFREPLIRNMGSYIAKMHIAGNWFVNFADGGARINIAGPLIYRYGRRCGDDGLTGLGLTGFHSGRDAALKSRDSLGRLVRDLFLHDEMSALAMPPPMPGSAWLPDTQVLVARDNPGTPDGFFLAAKGGHNAESHNHNDVGSFIVFRDGEPVLIDAGVGTYTRKTFSPERYTIWTMQSAYHNLPTVNGIMQKPGRGARATDVSCSESETGACLSLNVAAAYPLEAGIEAWHRTITLTRGAGISVRDEYRLAREENRIESSLITPCTVRRERPGRLVLVAPGTDGTPRAALVYDPDTLSVTVEPVPIDDARLAPVWGDMLYRIVLAADAVPGTGSLSVAVLPA